MKTSYFSLLSIMAAVVFAASPVFAHHSAAGVDHDKTLSVKGTLKQFAWSAPHAAIVLNYVDETGATSEISVSTFTPALLLAQGFTPKDFRRGDKLEVFYHPNRSGASGGILSKIVLADGRMMNGEAAQGGGDPAAKY